MKTDRIFELLESSISCNPKTVFWWRDDDVSTGRRLHFIANWMQDNNLEKMITLSNRYAIRSVFAVIPNNFLVRGKKQIALLKEHGVYVALHGMRHINNSNLGIPSEFPDNCNVEVAFETIHNYKEAFSNIFGDKFLPIFVPPWNNISLKLAKRLCDDGFTISTFNSTDCEYSNVNVDVDVIDWNRRELRDESAIINDIITLINKGQKSIGIMGHHNVANTRAFSFFEKLFQVLPAKIIAE